MGDTNLIIIIVAFIVAVGAIYCLYSIILYQGGSKKNGEELQLTTKNILEQVNVLFSKKEYALVELLATKYLERVPKHFDVRRYLAKAYYENKKYNLAVKQCALLLKQKSNDIETHKLLAACYKQKDADLKAIQEYEIVFEQDKEDISVIKSLAELYKKTEQIFSSIEAYNTLTGLLTNDSDIASIQSIIAELNEEAHDYAAAFEAYKKRLSIYPEDIATNRKLIELYIKVKNYPVAIDTLLYMDGFVTDPKITLWIYETLIELYDETNNYEKAIEYAEKTLNLPGTNNTKIKNQIATFNINMNNIEQGIKILEELVIMSQRGFDVTIELANAYIKNGNYDKAFNEYKILLDKATQKEAKAINLAICEAYIKNALFEIDKSNYDKANELLELATQYNPINSEVYYNMAIVNNYKGNYGSAAENINKALEYNKQSDAKIKYLLLLAETQHNLEKYFEEKKALSDLLYLDNKQPEALYRMGLLNMLHQDFKDAEDNFKKAIEYDPEHIKAKYNLALIYQNNNHDKAKELIMEILEIDPSFDDARRLLENLTSNDLNF